MEENNRTDNYLNGQNPYGGPQGMPNPYAGQPQGTPNPYGGPQGMPNPYGGQPQGAQNPYGSPQGMPNPYAGRPQGAQNPYGEPQMNYSGQPGYYGIPQPNPGQGLQYAKPKKNKAGLIIGIFAVAAVLFVVFAGLLFSRILARSPKKQLAKGFANMVKEMQAYNTSLSEDIDFAALAKLRNQQPMHTDIDFSFTVPGSSGSFDNFNIELDTVSDIKNKQGIYDLKLGVYGMDVDAASFVADNNTLYMASDLLFKDTVYCLDLENIGKDFDDSAWSDMLGTTLSEDASYTLFPEDAADKTSADPAKLAGIYKKYSAKLASAVKYESITDKEKKEYAHDGGYHRYGGVKVIIDKDAFNEVMINMKNDLYASNFYKGHLEKYKNSSLGNYAQYKEALDANIEKLMGLEFERDIVLNFYMDKRNRIIGIETPEDLAVSGRESEIDSIAVSIAFEGDERALDSVEGGIYMRENDEILYAGISRTANIREDSYYEDITLRFESNAGGSDIVVFYRNNWGYEDKTYDMAVGMERDSSSVMLYLKGAYENIEKGKGFTFRLDNATLSLDETDELIVRGIISTEPSDGAKIKVPENAVDILGMSEEEIQMAVWKAVAALSAFQ